MYLNEVKQKGVDPDLELPLLSLPEEKNSAYFAFTWHLLHTVGPAGLLAFFASL